MLLTQRLSTYLNIGTSLNRDVFERRRKYLVSIDKGKKTWRGQSDRRPVEEGNGAVALPRLWEKKSLIFKNWTYQVYTKIRIFLHFGFKFLIKLALQNGLFHRQGMWTPLDKGKIIIAPVVDQLVRGRNVFNKKIDVHGPN